MSLLLLILVFLLPEKNNYTMILIIPVWITWALDFSVFVAYMVHNVENIEYFIPILALHHLLLTCFVLYSKKTGANVLWLDLVFSIIGFSLIWYINIKKKIEFHYVFFYFLHYFLSNIFYYVITLFFCSYTNL